MPGMPKRIAKMDTSRPIPQNNAIEIGGLLSDFSDEAAEELVTRGEIRMTFDISGSPI
jgi:hypothetical protein